MGNFSTAMFLFLIIKRRRFFVVIDTFRETGRGRGQQTDRGVPDRGEIGSLKHTAAGAAHSTKLNDPHYPLSIAANCEQPQFTTARCT